jgi:hypothetical protein
MPIFMETTMVSPEKTVGEIQATLAKYGATQIRTDFLSGKPVAVSFIIPIKGHEVPFQLPCRWERVKAILVRDKIAPRNRSDNFETWAIRVAWRQIFRWIQAQLAMVETDMVKFEEVFLPYAQTPNGLTFFQEMDNRGFLLEGPK